MYYSSKQTKFFKYLLILLPIVMVGSVVIPIRIFGSFDKMMSIFESSLPIYFFYVFIILMVFNFLMAIRCSFNLKYLSVDDSCIYILDKKNKSKIEYNQIYSIDYFKSPCTLFVTMKFKNIKENSIRKISFIPDKKFRKIGQSDEMSLFILAKAKQANPKFNPSNIKPRPNIT